VRALAFAGLGLFALAACTRAPAPAPRAIATSCHADVQVASRTPLVLDVEMACKGRALPAFASAEPRSVSHISRVTDERGNTLRRAGQRFVFEEPRTDARVRYRVDVTAIAREAESFDVALESGQSVVAPVSTWLMHPDPLTTDIPVTVDVHAPAQMKFETGLVRQGRSYTIEAHEIPVGTYAVFGKFDSERLRVDEATIDVAFADGRLDLDHATVSEWITASSRAVGTFWRKFPVPHVLVTVIPIPGRHGVLFGKVLPESAPGIVVLLGEHVTRERLYDDWILVHELFHLGVPSFSGEGKWFDEGLATYFEPIIRARAGFRSEESVWQEFRRAMPLGLEAVSKKGLEQAEDFGEVYWGGALLVLLADVEIRRATGGTRGLEDGLITVLDAGGHASEVWPLDKTLALSDEGCGVHALEPLARKHARSAERVDLDALWKQLGVEGDAKHVRLNPSAPLAGVRQAILRGNVPSERHASAHAAPQR